MHISHIILLEISDLFWIIFIINLIIRVFKNDGTIYSSLMVTNKFEIIV